MMDSRDMAEFMEFYQAFQLFQQMKQPKPDPTTPVAAAPSQETLGISNAAIGSVDTGAEVKELQAQVKALQDKLAAAQLKISELTTQTEQAKARAEQAEAKLVSAQTNAQAASNTTWSEIPQIPGQMTLAEEAEYQARRGKEGHKAYEKIMKGLDDEEREKVRYFASDEIFDVDQEAKDEGISFLEAWDRHHGDTIEDSDVNEFGF